MTALALAFGSLTLFFEYFFPPLVGSEGWNPIVAGLPLYVWLFLMASVVQFGPGLKFYKGTRDAVRARQANTDSLIAIGTTVAWPYSTLLAFSLASSLASSPPSSRMDRWCTSRSPG